MLAPMAQPNTTIKKCERVAFTLAEAASMMGHERTWAYRQVQAGKIRAIIGFGKMMIPASEIRRICEGKGGQQ